jgi:predicted molibdopterin-dependent oxidoreductase YjgC
VASPRGAVQARLRITGIRPGVLFVPFHYGYWDAPGQASRAANELTITEWDPLSKQPIFKTAAVRVRFIKRDGQAAAAPTTTASAPVKVGSPATAGGVLAHVEEKVA